MTTTVSLNLKRELINIPLGSFNHFFSLHCLKAGADLWMKEIVKHIQAYFHLESKTIEKPQVKLM